MADARLVLRDGAGDVENTTAASRPGPGHDVRPAHGGARDARRRGGGCCSSSSASPSASRAIVALRSVIQSVRGVLRQRSAVADRRRRADRDQPRLDARGARDASTRALARGRRHRRAPRRSRRRRWCGRRTRSKAVARMVGAARRCSPDFRCTARSTARAADRTRTRCSRDHGALVRPELLTALGVARRRPDRHRQTPFTIRGVIDSEPGGGVGGFSLGPRVLIDYADLPSTGLLGVRQPRAPPVMLVRCRTSGIEPLVHGAARRLQGTTSSTPGRTVAPRTRSAATSIAPRTT